MAFRAWDRERAAAILEDAWRPARGGGLSVLFGFCAYGGPRLRPEIAGDLIRDLERRWLEQRSRAFAGPYLDGSYSQPFREFAIMFPRERLDEPRRQLLERAAEFDDDDLREVIEDFDPTER